MRDRCRLSQNYQTFWPNLGPSSVVDQKSTWQVTICISHHAMYLFNLPLMKALDWARTSGNFVTIDLCPWIALASEVLNFQSVLHSVKPWKHITTVIIMSKKPTYCFTLQGFRLFTDTTMGVFPQACQIDSNWFETDLACSHWNCFGANRFRPNSPHDVSWNRFGSSAKCWATWTDAEMM